MTFLVLGIAAAVLFVVAAIVGFVRSNSEEDLEELEDMKKKDEVEEAYRRMKEEAVAGVRESEGVWIGGKF